MVQARIIAHGDVQGVGFRYSVRKRATALGLTGYVRNMKDASQVEVLAQGAKDDVQKLVDHIMRGPGLAHVVKVDVSWEEEPGKMFDKFQIEL